MNNNWIEEIASIYWYVNEVAGNIKLLSVISVDNDNVRLVISNRGEWMLDIRSNLLEINPVQPVPIIMPFLEMSYEDFKEKVYMSIEEVGGKTESVWKTLPVRQIILAGLRQKSDYWADLALKWLPFLSHGEQLSLISELKNIYNSKWASQKNRHRVLKFIKEIERNQ